MSPSVSFRELLSLPCASNDMQAAPSVTHGDMKQHFQVHSGLYNSREGTEVTGAWMKKAARDFHFLNDPAGKTTHRDINVRKFGLFCSPDICDLNICFMEPHKVCASART